MPIVKKMLLISVFAFVLAAAPVLAHEGREVGDYLIIFGWRVEPAYAGVYNGPELIIAQQTTGTPLEGAEQTLQLEVSLGDETMLLRLYPVWNDPGHYTADLIPSRPGDYSFRLTGTLGETEVDEVFTSADGEFSPVEPATDIVFPPAPDAAIADLQAQIADLQAQIDALRAMVEVE
jgi:hypothetical protein